MDFAHLQNETIKNDKMSQVIIYEESGMEFWIPPSF